MGDSSVIHSRKHNTEQIVCIILYDYQQTDYSEVLDAILDYFIDNDALCTLHNTSNRVRQHEQLHFSVTVG